MPAAATRAYGKHFNILLRIFLTDMLRFIGAKATAPLLSGMWRPVRDPHAGMASTWSERHAAYVAGLGTFSLNDGFITEKGIAHRCGSVITNVVIPPTKRICADPWSNCLFFREGSCGLCQTDVPCESRVPCVSLRSLSSPAPRIQVRGIETRG
jgi:epoxyqueuosine reductase